MNERFGSLRELLQREPSADLWKELREELELWGEEERERVALPYALDHVTRWPDAVQRVVGDEAPEWLWGLANVLKRPGAAMLEKIAASEGARRVRVIELWRVEEIEPLGRALGRFEGLDAFSLQMGSLEPELLALLGAEWPRSLRSVRVCILDEDLAPEVGAQIALHIASNEALRGLESLDLDSTAIGDEGARAIAQSPHLSRLRQLALGDTKLGEAGAQALAESANLASVTTLNLSWNTSLGMGLVALMSSPHLRALRYLGLDNVWISASCASALREVAYPSELEAFEINYHLLEPGALEALLDAPIMRLLRPPRELSSSLVDQIGLARLLKSPLAASLRLLRLSSLEAVEALGVAAYDPVLGQLERLSIYGCELTEQTCAAIAQSPLAARICYLDIDRCDGDVVALLERGAWSSLRELWISGERGQPMLDAASVARLAQSEALGGLRRLTLIHHQLDDEALIALCVSDHLSGLHDLYLGANRISDAGVSALAESAALPSLTKLGLERNRIGDEGARALARSSQLPALSVLDVAANQISDVGACELLRSELALRLSSVDLGGNGLTDASASAIALAGAPRAAPIYAWLASNHIGDAGLWALLRSPYVSMFSGIDLSFNLLSSEAIEALTHEPALAMIEQLSVYNEQISSAAWLQLHGSPYINFHLRIDTRMILIGEMSVIYGRRR